MNSEKLYVLISVGRMVVFIGLFVNKDNTYKRLGVINDQKFVNWFDKQSPWTFRTRVLSSNIDKHKEKEAV